MNNTDSLSDDESSSAPLGFYRHGRKQPQNIYCHQPNRKEDPIGTYIGVFFSPQDAATICATLNTRLPHSEVQRETTIFTLQQVAERLKQIREITRIDPTYSEIIDLIDEWQKTASITLPNT